MKKVIVIIAMLLGFAVAASAQPRALGVRLGYGAELSYQHGSETNFLEVDLGWNSQAIGAGISYDFVIAPLGPLNFYAGPSIGVGYVNEAGLRLNAGAQVGLEFPFQQIPLQISLDWRPAFQIIPSTAFFATNAALSFRYLF
ncbi:MAG: hypothetical protein IJU27_00305 [Bacteroidales bacterium]|nr:hypothetical protein [Bacteroidales bacterium]